MTTHTNVVIQTNNSVPVDNVLVYKAQAQTNYILKGIHFDQVGSVVGQYGLRQELGYMEIDNCRFGGASFAQIAISNSKIYAPGNLAFRGTVAYAIACQPFGAFETSSGAGPRTWTLVNFNATSGIFYVYNGNCQVYSVTFSGANGGKQWNVIWNGILYKPSTTVPGTTGSTATGGLVL
jgi:hypothetical protein